MSVETTVAGAGGAQGNSVQESGPIIKSFVEEKNTLITSTAKQVLGNCERMVLANFIGNMLSTFIL